MSKLLTVLTILCASFIAACSPVSGPDKTIAGAALGAGWGAGAGAVVGNQIGDPYSGAAVGTGFGFVDGALTGMNADVTESAQLKMERNLKSMRVQNAANGQELARLQGQLDRSVGGVPSGIVYQVYFDPDATSLRAGAIANLEIIGDSLRINPYVQKINVIGHADDNGSPEYNARISESRARGVAAYLAARGISMDRIAVASHGSSQPIASNSTEAGRQLNRRVDIFVTR